MSDQLIVKAPCFNPHGYTLAEVTGTCRDTRGQLMFEVRALNGTPWDDAGFFGSTPTNRARFYPQSLKRVKGTTDAEIRFNQ